MEEYHREIILNNIEDLIRLTNYDRLLQNCINVKLLFPAMKDDIEKCPHTYERHKLLFEKITRRGPTAFESLKSILSDLQFNDALRIMCPELRINSPVQYGEVSIHNQKLLDGAANSCIKSNESATDNKILKLELYTLPVEPKPKLEVKRSTKFHIHPILSTYTMKSRHRGVFFLVNIINFKDEERRSGADIDRDNLIHLFRGMEFDIFYYENLSAMDFDYLIDQLRTSHYLRRTDCLVFALLTHGAMENGELSAKFSDGNSYLIERIIEQFNNRSCHNLINKPKVFLFPFCKGKMHDRGIRQIGIETDHIRAHVATIPIVSDMKLCFGTVPGYVTYRHEVSGSWYIEVLYKVFAEYAHENSLDVMLKIIGEEIFKMGQGYNQFMIPSNEDRCFNKALFFNPAFYGDQNQ